MTENDKGVIDQNNKVGEDGFVEEIIDDKAEDVETLKKNLATAIAQKDHWKTKATKAAPVVEEKKEAKVEAKPEAKDTGLSQTDLYALVKADVPEEDISEITDYAKLKNITVAEALKSNVVKTILSEKKEERATAAAANTAKAKVGTASVSTDTLLANARKGILPDNDEDMTRLIKAKKGIK